MKAADFSQSALDALRARIEAPEVVEAFDRLVEFGLQSRALECAPGLQGRVRDFRYGSTAPRGRPFAFTASRAHLLFHVRPLAVRTLRLTKTLLARRIEVVRRRADAQLQIVVRNRREADAVVELLLARWPERKSPEVDRALAAAREGLGEFRARVEKLEGACRVTGVLDRRHLRAIHIKPWDACTDAERLDGNNGLLLSPHVAHLFERGYLSFDDDGQVLVAAQLNSTVLKRWAITLPVVPRQFGSRQKAHLAWHREHVFEKKQSGQRRRG